MVEGQRYSGVTADNVDAVPLERFDKLAWNPYLKVAIVVLCSDRRLAASSSAGMSPSSTSMSSHR